VGLASCYREQGQTALWKPTLEQFLAVPSLGLEHAWIHQLIADDYISRDEWSAAEPHALAAAQTWSAAGLLLAAEVYEGLGRWADSEQWIREASTSYPSGIGFEWYFWCRRTGRGDVEGARKLAEKLLTADWIAADSGGALLLLSYYLLEDNPQKALPYAKQNVEKSKQAPAEMRIVNHGYLAMAAYERGEKDTVQAALNEIHRIVTEEEKPLHDHSPDAGMIAEAICNLLDGKNVDERSVTEASEAVKKLPDESRRNYAFLLGRALELRNNVEPAEKLYRSIIHQQPFNKASRNLAGHYLSKRHGTSRP
jgi:hypothetical protein